MDPDVVVVKCKKERRKKRSEKECFTCGQYGHLSRFCREQTKNEAQQRLYVAPKRIEFKSAANMEAFRRRIAAFKQESSRSESFLPELYKPMITELVAYLLTIEHGKKLLCGRVSVGFANDLSGGGESGFVFAETSVVDASITFSCATIEEKLYDETLSLYPIENDYLQLWMGKQNRKENHLFWIVFHEFCHLFAGYNNDRHDGEFFEMVAELARNSSFVFE